MAKIILPAYAWRVSRNRKYRGTANYSNYNYQPVIEWYTNYAMAENAAIFKGKRILVFIAKDASRMNYKEINLMAAIKNPQVQKYGYDKWVVWWPHNTKTQKSPPCVVNKGVGQGNEMSIPYAD